MKQKTTRNITFSLFALFALAFGSAANAAKPVEVACYVVTKKAEQIIQKAEDKAGLADCLINLKFDADVAKCVEAGGDEGDCEDAADAKYEPKWTQNTIKYFNKVNNTIAKANAKLDTIQEEGPCNVALSDLPEPYETPEAAGVDVDAARDQCAPFME